jgi:glutamate/tyrosine decarboxylase-like PLP-dependent enzyme
MDVALPSAGGWAMTSSRLLKYVSTLSDEDRKKYKALIDEAFQNDQALAEVINEVKKHAMMYEENSIRLANTAREFHASLLRLNEKLAEVANAAGIVLEPTPLLATWGMVSTLRH